MLLGFDRPAAEVFVNLITGASLPDKGAVVSLGRPTSAIADSDEWLAFVEQFGILSDRIVLLEAMTRRAEPGHLVRPGSRAGARRRSWRES